MFIRGRPVTMYMPKDQVDSYNLEAKVELPTKRLKLEWVYPLFIKSALKSSVDECFYWNSVVETHKTKPWWQKVFKPKERKRDSLEGRASIAPQPSRALAKLGNLNFKLAVTRDLPGRPVVKTLPSVAGGMGSIRDWGTKIPRATGWDLNIVNQWYINLKKQKKKKTNLKKQWLIEHEYGLSTKWKEYSTTDGLS